MNYRHYTAALLMGLGLVSTAGAQEPQDMSVQVKDAELRDKPSFLGTITAKLAYGDSVSVTEVKDDWANATLASGESGWTHVSALTEKEIVLDPTAEDIEEAASNEEMVLAGKGFNSQVETEYRKSNAELDFQTIDEMESVKFTTQDLFVFLAEGEVGRGG